MIVKFSDYKNNNLDGYINELNLEIIPRGGEIVSIKDNRFDSYFAGKVHQVVWILDGEFPFVIIELLRE